MFNRNRDQEAGWGSIDSIVQPTVRVVLVLLILGALLWSLSFIPGTERVVIEPDITVESVLMSVILLVIFGTILNYATTVGNALASTLPEFPEIERIVQLVALLGILLASYRFFWWLPYFRDNPDQYDLVFLAAGILIVGWLGYLLYSNVDDISEGFTNWIIQQRYKARSESNRLQGAPAENTASESAVNAKENSSTSRQPARIMDKTDSHSKSPTAETTDSRRDQVEYACPKCGEALPVGTGVCFECGWEWE